MKKFFTLIAAMLVAVSVNAEEVDITSMFNYTWNASESLVTNDDGSITFNSVAWGGLAAWLATKDENDNDVPADWSAYSKVVFEWAETTTVNTQILVLNGDNQAASGWGNTGITSLECSFSGKDVSAVSQIALQTSDATTLTIKRIYLVTKDGSEPETPQDRQDIDYKSFGSYNASAEAFVLAAGAAGWHSKWFGTFDVTDWNSLVIEVESTNGDVQLVVQGDHADGAPENMMILASETPQKYVMDISGWTNISQMAFQNFNFPDPDIEDWATKEATAQETTMKVTAMYISKDAAPAEEVTSSRIIFTEAAEKGSLDGKQFSSEDGLLTLTITDTDGSKLEIDANNAYFGTADSYEKFAFRLKSGGKSSSKNGMTLTIGAEGTLKVYARTGSNSAEDRNLVLTQNEEELYNQIVKEADAVAVKMNPDEDKETNVYPVISVPVKAGTVVVTYPVNSLNFYGFELVSAGGSSNVESVVVKPVVTDGAIYNLRGQRVDASYKGIVIRNGKKYLVK